MKCNMDKKVPSIWTTDSTEVLNTGTWRNAIAVHQKRPAPCHGACPVGGDIPTWVRQVREEEYREAWETLVQNNPLPASIGRTCHHPCEGGCNRAEYDGAVSINALEQYVGDKAIERGWSLPVPAVELDRKVAVIGGGPAGLSCAYQLRRKGFKVTVYDANPEPGGMLRYGVPEYRLPKKVVEAEIRRISDLGVEIVSGRRITFADLEDLEKEYGAVFIALGAHDPKRLPQFPRDDARVLDAVSFLRSVRHGDPMPLGKKVVVIGGGSVAMDVAGSALRLESAVKVLCLEGRSEMPAPEEEVRDALDEGAQLLAGVMVKAVSDPGSFLRLECCRAELDPGAPPGVIRPVEVKGTGFGVEADTVILAAGQDPELADWAARLKTERGMVVVDEHYMTSRSGIFAAGDVANLERFVSTAIGEGKKAAESIARHLGLQDGESDDTQPPQEVAFDDINTFYFPTKAKGERDKVEAEERRADFREIKQGLSEEEVRAQAERCFSCGACVECDNCLYFCPDMAVVKDPSSPAGYKVLEQYCKGCGCCLEECPRGAVGVKEEAK